MRRRKWCFQCKTKRIEPTSPSKDYCIGCHASIKERLEDPMLFVRAVGALIRATGPNDNRLKLGAFMHVFHPTYPSAKLNKLLAGVSRDEP